MFVFDIAQSKACIRPRLRHHSFSIQPVAAKKLRKNGKSTHLPNLSASTAKSRPHTLQGQAPSGLGGGPPGGRGNEKDKKVSPYYSKGVETTTHYADLGRHLLHLVLVYVFVIQPAPKKWEPPVPTRFGKKKKRGPDAVNKLPPVYPTMRCKLKMLKQERIKDYLILEEGTGTHLGCS